jgi:hypothetical protein
MHLARTPCLPLGRRIVLAALVQRRERILCLGYHLDENKLGLEYERMSGTTANLCTRESILPLSLSSGGQPFIEFITSSSS